MLNNKLGITGSGELAQAEERISKKKAAVYSRLDNCILQTYDIIKSHGGRKSGCKFYTPDIKTGKR